MNTTRLNNLKTIGVEVKHKGNHIEVYSELYEDNEVYRKQYQKTEN